jgi:hypothetical protein
MPRPHPGDTQADFITVHVPIAVRRRGGRKTVTSPDGSLVMTAVSHCANSTLVKALARAFRWRGFIESGRYTSIQEIAAAEKINASYVGRILRLTLLAPDIVEAILNGQSGSFEVSLDGLMAGSDLHWDKQRQAVWA